MRAPLDMPTQLCDNEGAETRAPESNSVSSPRTGRSVSADLLMSAGFTVCGG